MTDITRRGFLATILAAATSGTLLSSPDVLAATEALAGDRIARAIRLAREVIAVHRDLYPKYKVARDNRVGRDSAAALAEANAIYMPAWELQNKLLTSMDADFPENPTTLDVEIMFRTPRAYIVDVYGVNDLLDESYLRQMVVEIVPIAIIRELIHAHRVMFDTRYTTAFTDFAMRYKDVIMGSRLSPEDRAVLDAHQEKINRWAVAKAKANYAAQGYYS